MRRSCRSSGRPRESRAMLCRASPVLGAALAMLGHEASAVEAPGRALEEVVVTAERKAQNAQDVPIAATVLSADELQDRGVDNINDLAQVSPSVAINTYNRQTFVNIRGIGLNRSAPTASPGVAYYIDGVLVPNDKFIGFSFYDIDAVEILRGPQGTLTGQNSTGGAIFIRTPTPNFDDMSAVVRAEVGNYGARRIEGATNLGADNIAVRMSAVHDERDSFTKNIGPSTSEPGNSDFDGARATVAIRGLDSKLQVFLRAEYFDSISDGIAVKNRFDAVTSDPFVIQEDAISFTSQEGHRLSAEVHYDFGDALQLRVLASDQQGVTEDQVDGDRTATALPIPAGLPANPANRAAFPGRVSRTRTEFDTFVAEVNLLSIGSGPLQWVLGGFYLDDEIQVGVFRDNHNTVDFVASDNTIDQIPRMKSKSLFGQAVYRATENWELLVGARYSSDEQTLTRFEITPNVFDPPRITTAESSEWTGKVAVNYHLDSALLYASVSKGYKMGGNNVPPTAAPFGPETNLVYELGFKSELLSRRLRLNGSFFLSDYRDLQFASLANGLPLTQNAARARFAGAELEALAYLGNASVNVGIGYLDGEFADDACLNDTNSTITSIECSPGNRLVPEGSVLPYAPKWTLNAGVQYDFAISDGMTVTPRLQWAYTSDQIATPFPSIHTYLSSRGVFDARLMFNVRDRYQIEAFVRNLTDETYVATQIQDASSSDGGYVYGAPRTWGIRVSAAFGQ